MLVRVNMSGLGPVTVSNYVLLVFCIGARVYVNIYRLARVFGLFFNAMCFVEVLVYMFGARGVGYAMPFSLDF